MAEYIEREAALACFHDWIDRHGDVHEADEMPEYRAVMDLPAADVVPWSWLERYASGMRMNYASSWVYEARKEYEGG